MKERVVYCNAQNNMVRLELLRSNINDDYNLYMGDFNVADQLRYQNHYDQWIKEFK